MDTVTHKMLFAFSLCAGHHRNIKLSLFLETVHNIFTCRVSMHGRCHVWPRLIEFSGVVLTCFMLSGLDIFTEVSPLNLEDSPKPLFEAIFHLMSCVGETGFKRKLLKLYDLH